ncbi:MarR family transcriptional regulator [Lactiplantibacillus garii]|uniref:MarR family transcriptional regulator n=1 Tax=Lactiplantibacillus garii TaxID=2306423 RepID=A0A3R8J7M2_9LACO|nr:MarR family transcriptional regulator [Lactiplantibacillus garii]RRK10565.1 MarR family transcriptional regulator [Lactiplantibacillus garii]
MTTNNRDLFNSFGRLFQNRAFFMAIAHQQQFGRPGAERGGRGQMRLLQLLAESPAGLTNAEIAEILDIRPSSVSATLSRLEDADLIVREPSRHDKRVVIVRLSEQGQKLASHRDQGMSDLADQLFGCLTDDEQAELQRLLDKLSANAADLDVQDLMHFGHEHGWPQRPGWGHGRGWF